MLLKEALAMFNTSPAPSPTHKARVHSSARPETEAAGFLDRPVLHEWSAGSEIAQLPGFASDGKEPITTYGVRSKNAGNRVDQYLRVIDQLDIDPKQQL
jgi:hypothetical protein